MSFRRFSTIATTLGFAGYSGYILHQNNWFVLNLNCSIFVLYKINMILLVGMLETLA